MAPPSFAQRLAFVAAASPAARAARAALEKRYGGVPPAEADVIVALGGDGLMLQALHRNMKRRTPIFGMNLGTVGFLLNTYRATGLPARLREARRVLISGAVKKRSRTASTSRPSRPSATRASCAPPTPRSRSV